MAVANIEKTQLRLVFMVGTDPETQEPIFKRKTFNHVKAEADAEGLLAVAEALAALQQFELSTVERMDLSQIESD